MATRRVVFVVSLTLAVALSVGRASAQKESSSKLGVGIVPFNGSKSTRMSEHNATVLANQLSTELSQSRGIAAHVLTLPAGTKLPLPSAKASEIGRAAGVDMVVVPTVLRVQVKGSARSPLGRVGRLSIPLGEREQTASAEVALQVELIRSKDSSLMDTFTVEGKNTASSLKPGVGNYNDLGSTDAASPGFRGSPLGRALHDAMAQLVARVEARAAKEGGSAETATAKPSGAEAGAGTSARQQPRASEDLKSTHVKPPADIYAETLSSKEKPSGAAAPSTKSESGTTRPSPGKSALSNLFSHPFSADQITTTTKESHRAKVNATERAFRMEAEEKGQKSITILRTDRNVMLVLLPAQKMYMEMSLNLGQSFMDAAKDPEAKVERESLGREQVGSYHCDKYRVRVTYKGNVYSGLQWAAKELDGFVVKMMDEKTKATTEYQNIRLGPQDPSLFEVPPGYQKFSMPGMKLP